MLKLLRLLRSLAIQMFYLLPSEYIIFLKNRPQRGVYRNVNLDNLENVLQINLRTDSAGEFIFRESGGTNFKSFSAQRQPWWRLFGFDT